MGLNSPEAPYVVVDVHYWQDHTRPWWETPHAAFKKLGLKHIMGSMAIVLFMEHGAAVVNPAQAMYEYAMASDGYWCWVESDYDLDDWRTYAAGNQRLRQVESKLGEYILRGRQVPAMVTLVEQTGNPLLERALAVQKYENDGRFLFRVTNGNADYGVSVRLRFGGIDDNKPRRLRDPLHGVDYSSEECIGLDRD